MSIGESYPNGIKSIIKAAEILENNIKYVQDNPDPLKKEINKTESESRAQRRSSDPLTTVEACCLTPAGMHPYHARKKAVMLIRQRKNCYIGICVGNKQYPEIIAVQLNGKYSLIFIELRKRHRCSNPRLYLNRAKYYPDESSLMKDFYKVSSEHGTVLLREEAIKYIKENIVEKSTSKINRHTFGCYWIRREGVDEKSVDKLWKPYPFNNILLQ